MRSFLPFNWQDLAVSTVVLKGLRENKSAKSLLRPVIHLECACWP